MARRNPVIPTTIRGFSDYFDLSASVNAVVQALGYTYQVQNLALPRYAGELPFLPDLQHRLERAGSLVALDSEIARREFLIAPLLFEVAMQFNVRIDSEFALDVSETLRGNIDYLLTSAHSAELLGQVNLVVIEAKLGDLVRGFKQLAAELCAVDQWTDSATPVLHGAVTIGNAWQFGKLERATRTLIQNNAVYGYPQEIETIVRALVAMLQESEPVENL